MKVCRGTRQKAIERNFGKQSTQLPAKLPEHKPRPIDLRAQRVDTTMHRVSEERKH